jgi:hypothetical protein
LNLRDQQPADSAAAIDYVIYAFLDPINPARVKIGKDQAWPQRYRQAQAHVPRQLQIVGVWPRPGSDRGGLTSDERQALRAFPRAADCDGREWVEADAEGVQERLTALFGPPAQQRAMDLRPFDDWRDWPQPNQSLAPRWMWIGQEVDTGRLKLVHSANARVFARHCPTYNQKGLRWREAWAWHEGLWTPSKELHPLDRRLVSLWRELVGTFGGGENDLRLGWLNDGVLRSDLRIRLAAEGLRQVDLRTTYERLGIHAVYVVSD